MQTRHSAKYLLNESMIVNPCMSLSPPGFFFQKLKIGISFPPQCDYERVSNILKMLWVFQGKNMCNTHEIDTCAPGGGGVPLGKPQIPSIRLLFARQYFLESSLPFSPFLCHILWAHLHIHLTSLLWLEIEDCTDIFNCKSPPRVRGGTAEPWQCRHYTVSSFLGRSSQICKFPTLVTGVPYL